VKAAVEPAGAVDWDALARSPEPVIVVLRDAAEAERAFAGGMTPARVQVLNVGNVHYSQGRRQITPSVFLSGPEVDALRRLSAAGFRVEARAVPLDAPVDLAEIERRWNAAG
jgi:mannose/fructose/N-acetylgalactosamine-specific phosphotransferase system component IIB